MDSVNKHFKLDVDIEDERRCNEFLSLLGRSQTKFLVRAANFVLDKYNVNDLSLLTRDQAKLYARVAFDDMLDNHKPPLQEKTYKGDDVKSERVSDSNKDYDDIVKTGDNENNRIKARDDTIDTMIQENASKDLDPGILDDLALFG